MRQVGWACHYGLSLGPPHKLCCGLYALKGTNPDRSESDLALKEFKKVRCVSDRNVDVLDDGFLVAPNQPAPNATQVTPGAQSMTCL